MTSLTRLLPRLQRRYAHSAPSLPRIESSHLCRPFSGTHQNRYAVKLMDRRGAKRHQFLPCVAYAAEMKEKRIEPNLVIYNSMLAATAEDGLWLDSWAILDDMLLMGIKPNAMSFSHLLHAVRFRNNQYVAKVLEKMEACGVKHNAQTLAPIISRHVDENNLEMAVRQLFSASMQDLVPDHQTMQPVIILAARNNFARLALDLVDWFEGMSNRRLGESVWVNCLIAAAETAYVEGVERCWEVVTKRFRTLLDEGVCFAVLNTAARGGLPSLATEALHMLQTINISPQEHHFAAIIEAFCRKGQVKEAILVLDLMSSSGVPSSMETTEPILEYIQKDVKEIDAAWKHVEELHKEGHRLDISLPQSIIIAAIAYGDLSRALAFYSALPELEHSPNLDMYNYLLQGCVQVADRLLGDSLLADMKTTKVKPNPVTYETVIRLCLTQSIYEDAFFYLEEMKAAGHKPSLPIYTALVEKCLDSNDTRHEIALQEMQECGYAVPPSLELRLATNTPLHLSDAERRFIERGGLV